MEASIAQKRIADLIEGTNKLMAGSGIEDRHAVITIMCAAADNLFARLPADRAGGFLAGIAVEILRSCGIAVTEFEPIDGHPLAETYRRNLSAHVATVH